jgi:hypothetical protein
MDYFGKSKGRKKNNANDGKTTTQLERRVFSLCSADIFTSQLVGMIRGEFNPINHVKLCLKLYI